MSTSGAAKKRNKIKPAPSREQLQASKLSLANKSRKSKLSAHQLKYVSILFLTVLPLTFDHRLWVATWRGLRSRAWDGTGHFAAAQIYNQTIFPDTFGWTQAYFGGMPFPNFYPPLFYC